jgi:hypothetical protein
MDSSVLVSSKIHHADDQSTQTGKRIDFKRNVGFAEFGEQAEVCAVHDVGLQGCS